MAEVEAAVRGTVRATPTALNKYEILVRKAIGGGEISNLKEDLSLVRAGGSAYDAMLYVCTIPDLPKTTLLKDVVSPEEMVAYMGLETGKTVGCDLHHFGPRNFNENANAGPSLLSFGIRRKKGLYNPLRDLAFDIYRAYMLGVITEEGLPFLAAQLGARTKLRELREFKERSAKGQPLGRGVIGFDALEQFFFSPLVRAFDELVKKMKPDSKCPLKHKMVRQSLQFVKWSKKVMEAQRVVGADASQYDTRRPSEDVIWAVDVILAHFNWEGVDGQRRRSFFRAVAVRVFSKYGIVMEGGEKFTIIDGTPTGSALTSSVNTIMTSGYLYYILKKHNLTDVAWISAAGDDFLIGFYHSNVVPTLELMRDLQQVFDFVIKHGSAFDCSGDYAVKMWQATFKPGTNLKRGTSSILRIAKWKIVRGGLKIDNSLGLSHRVHYGFFNKPHFLGCYMLPSGLPIRRASECRLRMLHPEGICKNPRDYMQRCLNQIVDNPFHETFVNQMFQRFLVCVSVLCSCGTVSFEIGCKLARQKLDPKYPYWFLPGAVYWRRTSGVWDLEEDALLGAFVAMLRKFHAEVILLHARTDEGLVEHWQIKSFMQTSGVRPPRHWGYGFVDAYDKLLNAIGMLCVKSLTHEEVMGEFEEEECENVLAFDEYRNFVIDACKTCEYSTLELYLKAL